MSSIIPVIDITELIAGNDGKYEVAKQIGDACRIHGFFYISGHGVSDELQEFIEELSIKFYSQPLEEKEKIRMSVEEKKRGYYGILEERTATGPDFREVLTFGKDLPDDHPYVSSGHYKPNQYPDNIQGFRAAIIEYFDVMEKLGTRLIEAIAISLGLDDNYFYENHTKDPHNVLLLVNYPPPKRELKEDEFWGVGEHSDFGFLTILKQDMSGGLQIKSGTDWIDAHPIKGTFVCNIGDMLSIVSGGQYVSTAHRVRNPANHSRQSYPFFIGPNFNSIVKPFDSKKSDAKVTDYNDELTESVIELRKKYDDYRRNVTMH